MRGLMLLVWGIGALSLAAGAQPGVVDPGAVPEPADVLVRYGDSLRAAELFYPARRAYRAALETDPLTAHLRLGVLDLEENRFGRARRHFEAVLNAEPDHLDALYYRAITLRYIGLGKPAVAHAMPVLKKLFEWHKAEQDFQAVLARDSLHRDVLYQYAVFKRDQRDYRDAIWLGHRQIALRPDLVEPHIGLLRLYRFYLENTRGGGPQRWLAGQPAPEARFALGEWHRRRGRWADADSIYHALLDEPTGLAPQPVLLALARTAYARGDAETGQHYVERAIAEIDGPLGAAYVFEDAKYIVTDEEYAAYRRLGTNDARIGFFRAFWRKRDPTPAAPANPRLTEHYRRLRQADDRYAFDGFRRRSFQVDPYNELDFPRAFWLNREYNDRGLVYIRHGDPDRIYETLGNPDDLLLNQSWRYETPGLTFHFLIDPETAADEEWRLAARLPDPRLFRQRQPLGGLYVRMVERLNNSITASLADVRQQDEIGAESRENVWRGLTTDRHTWPASVHQIDLPATVAFFRGAGGRSEMLLAYEIPLDDFARRADGAVDSLTAEAGFALHTLDWNAVARQHGSGALATGAAPEANPVRVYRYQVKPGRYHLAYHVGVPEAEAVASHRGTRLIPDFAADTLMLSDVVLADRVTEGGGPFVRNGLAVYPNPTGRFTVDAPVHLYFEIYALAPDAARRTRFTIDYTLRPEERRGRLFGLFGRDGGPALTLSVERTGSTAESVERAELDVSGVPPGAYTLVVRITDRAAGRSVAREVPLRLERAADS